MSSSKNPWVQCTVVVSMECQGCGYILDHRMNAPVISLASSYRDAILSRFRAWGWEIQYSPKRNYDTVILCPKCQEAKKAHE